MKLTRKAWEDIGKVAGWYVDEHVDITAAILNKDDMPKRKKEIDLTGPQGNAFVLLGIARDLARQLKRDPDVITEEMQSGDYENLISVFDREFGDYVDLVR